MHRAATALQVVTACALLVAGGACLGGAGADGGDCQRPQVGVQGLNQPCAGGEPGCGAGQSCTVYCPSCSESRTFCLILCGSDCDCPAGHVCRNVTPMAGNPVAHCELET